MEPAEVVLRFLESVGRRSEAEFYISLFRAEPKEQFAEIGRASCRERVCVPV